MRNGRELSVGMMLVGKHFDEPTIYRGARLRAGGRLEGDVSEYRTEFPFLGHRNKHPAKADLF